MSTRATIHFHHLNKDTVPDAIIYRHSDGYPDGLGKDLEKFFKEVRDNINDNRFNDPSYLAAKWVVWDAARYIEGSRKYVWKSNKTVHYLDFLGIGICGEDPSDIEYRYHVLCKDSNIPEVIIEEIENF